MLRSSRADVGEHGRRAGVEDDVRGRGEGQRRRDHLVARPDAGGEQRQVHAGRAGADRDGVLARRPCRELGSKRCVLGP